MYILSDPNSVCMNISTLYMKCAQLIQLKYIILILDFITERLIISARHSNPATRSHLALYVC